MSPILYRFRWKFYRKLYRMVRTEERISHVYLKTFDVEDPSKSHVVPIPYRADRVLLIWVPTPTAADRFTRTTGKGKIILIIIEIANLPNPRYLIWPKNYIFDLFLSFLWCIITSKWPVLRTVSNVKDKSTVMCELSESTKLPLPMC